MHCTCSPRAKKQKKRICKDKHVLLGFWCVRRYGAWQLFPSERVLQNDRGGTNTWRREIMGNVSKATLNLSPADAFTPPPPLDAAAAVVARPKRSGSLEARREKRMLRAFAREEGSEGNAGCVSMSEEEEKQPRRPLAGRKGRKLAERYATPTLESYLERDFGRVSGHVLESSNPIPVIADVDSMRYKYDGGTPGKIRRGNQVDASGKKNSFG